MRFSMFHVPIKWVESCRYLGLHFVGGRVKFRVIFIVLNAVVFEILMLYLVKLVALPRSKLYTSNSVNFSDNNC